MTMHKFVGFDVNNRADGGQRLTGVPASFFTELMPQITNVNELKVTLYFFYLAGRKRGDPKWVGYWELEASQDLLSGLRKGGDPRPPQEHLREGLELALARGTLLRVLAASAPSEFFDDAHGELEPVDTVYTTWFLLNTASNRDFIKSLESGEIALENTNLLHGLDIWDLPMILPDSNDSNKKSEAGLQVDQWVEKRWEIKPQHRDIYTLFEQNIATLTPLISEQLREAAQLYPPDWIEDAFNEAVSYNRRNWRYISRILENWSIEGRQSRYTYDKQQRGYRQNGRERQSESQSAGQDYSQSGRNTRLSGRAGDDQPGRRSTVGTNGTRTPEAHGQPNVSPEPRTRRFAAPNQSAGPIDFTKYTTGKYAYLTQRDEPGDAPDPETDSE